MSVHKEFNFQSPLEDLHHAMDKTPQHWFDEYAAWVQKTPKQNIPFINNLEIENVNDKNLVCFRGMISNQLNPEYFCSQFVTNNSKKDNKIHCGLYCNGIDFDFDKNETILFDDPKTKTMQRYPMLLVAPPNQTNWMLKQTANQMHPNTEDFDEKNNSNTNEVNEHSNNSNNNVPKLVATFYSHETSLKICDLVDIYGIWYRAPSVKSQSDTSESKKEIVDSEQDDAIGSEIGSDLPSIHVLYWKKVENSFNGNIIHPTDNLSITKFNGILEEMNENVSDIRESLIRFIASYFGNDNLVAEYVLLNMISKVVTRKHGVLIGNFSLNLTGFSTLNSNTKEAVDKINELYSLLMPYLMKIDITVETMNEGRFVPCKNHETNELELNTKTNLQLLNGTSLIVNQIPLKTGQLNEIGILNCGALTELIEKQIVNYDFKFNKISFETDCNILVLSEKNPLKQLECSANIKVLHCSNSISEDCETNELDLQPMKASEEQLTQWRNYICVARLLLERFTLPENMCKLVEEDFVNLRKERQNVIEDDLHFRLTMLRLMNASFLKQEAEQSALKQIQDLENQRMKRNEIK